MAAEDARSEDLTNRAAMQEKNSIRRRRAAACSPAIDSLNRIRCAPERNATPRRGMSFREPHSRGPCQGFYTPGRGKAEPPAAAKAALSIKRMRAAFSSAASPTALLQRGVRTGRTTLVALEGSAGLPGEPGGQREAQPAEPALSGASQNAPASSAGRSGCGAREGNH